MHFYLRQVSIAVCLSTVAALTASPAQAADTGAGSKNFHPPVSAPNYFSNEAGPLLGGAAETRRGELYGAAAAPARAHVAVATAPHHAAAKPSGRRSHARARHERHRHGHHAVVRVKAVSHARKAHTVSHAHKAHAATRATKAAARHRRGRS